jgi:hypothetical protein
MSKKRKCAADYRIDYKSAVDTLAYVESKIRERLYDLASANPEVPIMTAVNGDTLNKAKSLVNKYYIETLNIETQFYFIELIEKFNADLIGKQLEIDFSKI